METSPNTDPEKHSQTHQPPQKEPRPQSGIHTPHTRVHIQTQRHPPTPPEQAKSRIKKGRPAPPGGAQDGEATSGCGATQMANKALLPQRPRHSGADMGTHTSRTIITKPPDAQTGGWTYTHTDTHTQTQALGRSNTQAQDSYKDRHRAPRNPDFQIQRDTNISKQSETSRANTELTQPE